MLKRLLITIALLFALPALADKPNILFIAIDDLRPELGCYGSPIAVTPSLDKLAEHSLLFERAYCNIPVCGASRASLFTGMYPTKKRFTDFDTKIDEDAPGAVTLPQLFKEAGYTTLSNGKIIHHPTDTQDRSWSEPAWKPKGGGARGLLPETLEKRSKRGRGYILEAADVDEESYPDGRIARKTTEDLKRLAKQDRPFFLACGFMKPHLPFYAPKKYWDFYEPAKIPLADNRYKPKGSPDALRNSGEYRSYHLGDLKINSDRWHREMKHGYLACTSYVDAQIGRVLDSLKELGLADNTIIVVWGDHGFHLGEHNFWGKHNTLDHSTRVPLIIHVPKSVLKQNAAGKKTAALVETVDLFPTLVELAGLEAPDALQGRSMMPLFTDPGKAFRASVYLRYKRGDTVITDHFAFTRFDTDAVGEMLFDHSVDPAENKNLADAAGYVPDVRNGNKLLDRRIKEAAGK
ncbi:MAG: sulfatase [Planctomycetota bacterium]